MLPPIYESIIQLAGVIQNAGGSLTLLDKYLQEPILKFAKNVMYPNHIGITTEKGERIFRIHLINEKISLLSFMENIMLHNNYKFKFIKPKKEKQKEKQMETLPKTENRKANQFKNLFYSFSPPLEKEIEGWKKFAAREFWKLLFPYKRGDLFSINGKIYCILSYTKLIPNTYLPYITVAKVQHNKLVNIEKYPVMEIEKYPIIGKWTNKFI